MMTIHDWALALGACAQGVDDALVRGGLSADAPVEDLPATSEDGVIQEWITAIRAIDTSTDGGRRTAGVEWSRLYCRRTWVVWVATDGAPVPPVPWDDGDDWNLIITGPGPGDAVRTGSGAGSTWRTGSGDGDAIRAGAGDGDAIRTDEGEGAAWRTDEGDGDAIRAGAGDGAAWRTGSGDGCARGDGGAP